MEEETKIGAVEEILSNEEILSLATRPEVKKLVEYLKARLTETRATVDTVSQTSLPNLQGRIITLKEIIDLFEDIIDESRS